MALSGRFRWCVERRGSGLLIAAAAVLLLLGCKSERSSEELFGRRTPPPFSGPEFLRGTIGSYSALSNGNPIIVSGVGLVVGLEGTGSNVVPPEWRERLLRSARLGGVGQQGGLTPAQLLASNDTAVVMVEALIPPGASKGLPIDLLVSTIPQTQVTSLVGGTLWSTELSMLGANPTMVNRTMALGRGSLYVNPFSTAQPNEEAEATQAVVIGGGVVTEERMVELVLRQPNFALARAITDRLNERFPRQVARGPNDPNEDKIELADAKSDSVIRLTIPHRFANEPQRLLNLVMHLYIERGPQFEEYQARQLAQVLTDNPAYAEHVIPAWEALGKSVLVGLREYYTSETPHVRVAALEAGARLGDMKAVEALVSMADSPDAQQRRQAAELLGYLSQHVNAMRALRNLVDDDDVSVRLAAYESLAAMGDTMVRRTIFEHEKTGFKFLLDVVPAQRPMLYIAQSPLPRVVVFNPRLGFQNDELITLWDGRLMLRRAGQDEMKVFYQKRGDTGGDQWPPIAPAVANLVVLLGHAPNFDHPLPGADLDFGQVTNVLYTLWKQGHIPAEMHLQLNPLSARLASARQNQIDGPRREFGDDPQSPDVPPTDVDPDAPAGHNDEALGLKP